MPVISLSKNEDNHKYSRKIDIIMIVKIIKIFDFSFPLVPIIKRASYLEYYKKYGAKFSSINEHYVFVNFKYKGILNLKRGSIYRIWF